MRLKQLMLFIIFVVLSLGVVSAQEDTGSQIQLAYNADLIIVGEAVSLSTDTFKVSAFSSTHDTEVFQSVVFQVEKVLKGNHSSKYLRTMIGYNIQYAQLPFPERLEVSKGRKYILLIRYKLKPEQCKNLPDEEFNKLDCYQIIEDAVIIAVKEEIEAIMRLVTTETPCGAVKRKLTQPPKKKVSYISESRKKSPKYKSKKQHTTKTFAYSVKVRKQT
jgi:hypothetical protein